MRKRHNSKLDLHRETLRRLDGASLGGARGGGLAVYGTLTVEPPCGPSDVCPPETGCTSTLSCTQ